MDANTGNFKYLTHIHEGIVPKKLDKNGKKVQVNNDEVFVSDIEKEKNLTRQ